MNNRSTCQYSHTAPNGTVLAIHLIGERFYCFRNGKEFDNAGTIDEAMEIIAASR